jgi:hypothetical protein
MIRATCPALLSIVIPLTTASVPAWQDGGSYDMPQCLSRNCMPPWQDCGSYNMPQCLSNYRMDAQAADMQHAGASCSFAEHWCPIPQNPHWEELHVLPADTLLVGLQLLLGLSKAGALAAGAAVLLRRHAQAHHLLLDLSTAGALAAGAVVFLRRCAQAHHPRPCNACSMPHAAVANPSRPAAVAHI